jgi:hypothetical protein
MGSRFQAREVFLDVAVKLTLSKFVASQRNQVVTLCMRVSQNCPLPLRLGAEAGATIAAVSRNRFTMAAEVNGVEGRHGSESNFADVT